MEESQELDRPSRPVFSIPKRKPQERPARKLLTKARVASLTKQGVYGDMPNLWLRVGPRGNKVWLFRYMHRSVRHEMGIGPVDLVSLDEARDHAVAFRRLLREGVDPIQHRKQERNAKQTKIATALTFQAVSQAYVQAHRAKWKREDRAAAEWEHAFRDHAKTLLPLAIGAIETTHILEALKPIWNEKPKLASRLRAKIEAVLGFATANKQRLGDNPATLPALKHLLPPADKLAEKTHHAALPYADLPAFMVKLALQPGSAARALTLTILTAVRSGEARGALWSEINFKAKLWTIPATRMKAGKEHSVPLSPQAIELLEAQQKAATGDLVFPSRAPGKPVVDSSLMVVIRRMGYPDVTAHGFRSSFRDWAGDETEYPRELAEQALAHAAGDSTEVSYRRGTAIEKRRGLMNDWATYATTPPKSRPVFLKPEPKRPVFEAPKSKPKPKRPVFNIPV